MSSAVAAVRDAGLHVSSLCRGGFFTLADAEGRAAARADNVAGGAGGGLARCGHSGPGVRRTGTGEPGSGLARRMVADAIGELVPEAQRLGVRLGIEALHPMFCADRSVIASLGEAVDLALKFPRRR